MIILGSILLFESGSPSPIPSKITELKSKNWYAEKALVWKSYVEQHTSDEDAWLHYFVSSEFAGKDTEEIQAQISEKFPTSFLAHYTKFRELGWTNSGIDELKKALSHDDAQPISYEDQLIYAEIENADRAAASKRVYQAGLLHSSTLNYSYNLLMSVAEDGLLIMDGLHLTIPIWVSISEQEELLDLVVRSK